MPCAQQVALLPDSRPSHSGRLASYALTAAGDMPERNPADWVLEGLPVADATAADAAAADGTAQQPLAADGNASQEPAGAAWAPATGQSVPAGARAAAHAEARGAETAAAAAAALAAAQGGGGGSDALQG